MSEQEQNKDNEYLLKLIERYDFIESIIITDFDGSLMISAFKKETEEADEDKRKMRSALAYDFSVSINQISKTEKWKTKAITTFFDEHIIYQRKLNKVAICHIICNQNEYCHEVINTISDEICNKFASIEGKLEEIKKEVDNDD